MQKHDILAGVGVVATATMPRAKESWIPSTVERELSKITGKLLAVKILKEGFWIFLKI